MAYQLQQPLEAFRDLFTSLALGDLGEERRIGRARRNRVQLNAFSRQFPRHGLGKGDDAAFAGRINRFA